MFPAAGDGCFYIGMGGKGQIPNPSYEPYQCCPKQVTKGSKVAKLQHKIGGPKTVVPKPTPKPSKKVPAAPPSPTPPAMKTVSRADHSVKTGKEGKEKNGPNTKGDKAKAKKGFFGTGKYIWWW